jgi:MFS family permease
MRERRFLALWAATGGANLADGITLFLLPVAAVLSGASPAGVAAVTVVGTLAWPVLGLPAGWVVDRVDRGRLLVAANVVRAAVIAAVATAAVVDGLALPVLLAAAALAGALEAIVDSALTALVPTVVDEADRTRANARIETTINLTNQLIGAPLAGFLAGLALSTAFGVAAALYAAAAAVALVLLSGPRAVAPATAATAVVDARVRAGLVYLWAHPLLRQLTLVTAAMNMVWGAFGAVFVIYALAESGLDLSPSTYGLLFTGAAVGGLVASASAEPLRRRFGARRLLLTDCVGTLLLVGPSALALGPWPVAAGVVAAGAGSSIWRVLVATIRQAVAPGALLGRVYSASRVISIGTVPLGAAIAGVLAELAGVRTALGAATVLAAVVVGWFLIGLRGHDLDAAFASPAVDAGAR